MMVLRRLWFVFPHSIHIVGLRQVPLLAFCPGESNLNSRGLQQNPGAPMFSTRRLLASVLIFVGSATLSGHVALAALQPPGSDILAEFLCAPTSMLCTSDTIDCLGRGANATCIVCVSGTEPNHYWCYFTGVSQNECVDLQEFECGYKTQGLCDPTGTCSNPQRITGDPPCYKWRCQ